MEPQETSHETHSKNNRTTSLISFAVFAALVASSYWTYVQWNGRAQISKDFNRSPQWSVETSAHPSAQAFTRVQDTSFWARQNVAVLTSPSTLATQGASIVMTNSKSKARVIVAPNSVVSTAVDGVTVHSGMALVSGLPKYEFGVLVPTAGADGTANAVFASIEPHVGSIHDLQKSERIDFTWSQSIQSAGLTLEFAREPQFTSVLFTQAIGDSPTASIGFADRSLGAWFVRLRSKENILAYTAFSLVESQTPDQLRRLGRRWLTWRDRALASVYRLEFAEDETFKKVAQSFQVRNREFDLSRVPAGRYFTRVTAAGVDGQEFTSRPLALQVQDKSEILRAGLELNDPDLKLFARGWKIVLADDEVSRIREGFVILRESELRGVKVADELFKGLARSEYLKRSEILKAVIFELSRDESFTNPERVKPDSDGELLPPALPLGILFARLRRIEKDGTLGSYGPASRLTTWLPAPAAKKAKTNIDPDATEVELKWETGTEVAGFELRLSPTREFTEETSTVIQTRTASKKVPHDVGRDLFWTVAAVNEFGHKVSMTSEVQEVPSYKPVERKFKALIVKAPRQPAMISPLVPVLTFPAEDGIIVGGATAKKYGKLKWDFEASTGFEVQIATDGDFVNIVEKAKIDHAEYTLQGDLPEGALFWRVRKLKTKLWSESRRFELVYE